jgi:hypothetical protein
MQLGQILNAGVDMTIFMTTPLDRNAAGGQFGPILPSKLIVMRTPRFWPGMNLFTAVPIGGDEKWKRSR